MSIPLDINGAVFEYPEDFNESWGVAATGWAQAVTNGMLQMQGGSFPLTADVNFGPNFGLLSKYFETRSAFPATVGTVRLSSADAGIAWRNNAHGGNLILTTDSSDNLLYNGHIIGASGTGSVLSITGTANQVIASSPTGNITLSLPQNIATGSSPTFAGLTLSSPLTVPNGGTGDASFTAYAVLTGGTTPTGALQSVASVGSAGQVLTSNGAGALPSYQNTTGTGTVNSGTATQVAYYATTSSTLSGNPGLLITGTTIPILNVNGSAGAIALLTSTSHQAGMELDNASGIFILRDVTNARNFLTYNPAGPTVSLVTPLAMGSNKVTGLASATTSGDAVSYGQSGAALSGLSITSQKITSLAVGTVSTDAANFGQLKVDLLGSQTVSGASTITFSGLAGASYNSYRLVFNNITTTAGAIPGTSLKITVSTSATFITTGYSFSQSSTTGSATTVTSSASTTGWIMNANANLDSTGPSSDGECEILGVSSTGTSKAALFRNFITSSAGIFAAQGSGQVITPAAVIDGVKITPSSGTLSGTFVLYGVRNS